MRRLLVFSIAVLGLVFSGCTGGAAGDPEDDIGDVFVLTHSPGNGDEIDTEDSLDGFNALNNPTLFRPGSIMIRFTSSVLRESVINTDPTDPQGTRNVRLFYFDTTQGPFDPNQPVVPGVNPTGANVLIPARASLESINAENDTLFVEPTGITPTNPLREGQYSVIVEQGVKGADGDGLKGKEYFFFFRVGQDNLGPVVVTSSPFAGERNVDPTSEIRITMSETILASTVNINTITVTFQPAGVAAPIAVPGNWFTDGGNGPGNNFPQLQLDQNGIPGLSGTSPRNGVDLVFRPDLTAFPVNMVAGDPPCQPNDPPRKGNKGLPLGQAITVSFTTQGIGVTDTAGNIIPAGSPNTTFTFETKSLPDPVFAPNANSAVYYGDTIGVGVIDVDPTRTPYLVGPNPTRPPNSVVTAGTGQGQNVVRVAIPDLVDMTTDTRPYSSFYSFACPPVTFNGGMLFQGNLYAASGSIGGGQVIVVDTYRMEPLGRFGTPSPGGVGLTAVGTALGNSRLVVSNFSANTVTVFDVTDVRWFTGASLWLTQGGLSAAVGNGSSQLILSEEDFQKIFPAQRVDVSSPPGPPIIGTINVGVSPTKAKITGLPNSLGLFAPPICFSPLLSTNTIVCSLNAGESTADFSELTNLSQSAAINPDLDGVNLSSQPTDVAWAPFSLTTGSYYFFITSVGGTVELFASGFISNQPSVRPNSSSNLSPNKIINNIGGLVQPASVQWIPSGNAVGSNVGYTMSVLVAETGENRLQQLSITSEVPSNLFETVNANHSAGLGPIDITGEPAAVAFLIPCSPNFTTYYVANAGEGTVRTASYQGGVIGSTINVPGVLFVASWWSR